MSELGAITPEDLAKQMPGWGAKTVRRLAKKLGACRILGNRMVLLPEDVQTILKATQPCPSESSSERPQTDSSGTIVDQLTGVDYEARLAQRTEKQRRKLQPRLKPANTKVISLRPRAS